MQRLKYSVLNVGTVSAEGIFVSKKHEQLETSELLCMCEILIKQIPPPVY